MQSVFTYERWMRRAQKMAQLAQKKGEVPVGALILDPIGKLLAVGYNRREGDHDPLAHAELMAITRASKKLKSWRLIGCTLYVTLEPCVMCAGAIVQSRIDHLVYGASDPKGGGIKSLYQIAQDPRLNHRLSSTIQVLPTECGQMLTHFFKAKRQK